MSEERDVNYNKGNIYLVYVAIGDTNSIRGYWRHIYYTTINQAMVNISKYNISMHTR